MRRLSLWGIVLWMGLVLACNAPFTEVTVPPAPTDSTDSETATPETPDDPEPATAEPTAEESDAEGSQDGEDESEPEQPTAAPETTNTPRPTFTPIQQPTLASTPTVPPTQTPRPTSSGSSATSTPVPGSSGPLTLEYNVSWALDPADPFKAIATVTLTASGGNGVYTYYHDEQPIDGPMFTYEWGACRGNPGSFRVDSGDGQSVKIDYFENPPCPTPTPTS